MDDQSFCGWGDGVKSYSSLAFERHVHLFGAADAKFGQFRVGEAIESADRTRSWEPDEGSMIEGFKRVVHRKSENSGSFQA